MLTRWKREPAQHNIKLGGNHIDNLYNFESNVDDKLWFATDFKKIAVVRDGEKITMPIEELPLLAIEVGNIYRQEITTIYHDLMDIRKYGVKWDGNIDKV